MKPLLLALALQGFFGADPSWLPDTDSHFETQVGHGLVTGALAGAGAVVAGEDGARWAALAAVGYYAVREMLARRHYRRLDLTPEERRKAVWDSHMDLAYPVVVATIPWTWGHRRKAWPLWLAAIGLTVAIGHATDPGGMYAGMH